MWFRTLASIGLLLGLGCAGDDTEEMGPCSFDEVAERPTREVAIGSSDARGDEPPSADFAEWEQGSTQELVFGFQGGYMLVPRLRLPAEPTDPADEFCGRVELRNESSYPVDPGFNRLQQFRRDGDFWFTIAMFDLLGTELEELVDQRVEVFVEVTSAELEARASVEVFLSPPT